MSDYRKLSAHMRAYKSRVYKNTLDAMRRAGLRIEQSAKRNLAANGSIQSGALWESIRSTGALERDNRYEVHIIADAKSPEGTEYAEFVEFGTGIHNEHGDGRQTPWRYQDQDGNWHTTRGQIPKPFIRPAFAEHLGELRKDIRDSIRVDGSKL